MNIQGRELSQGMQGKDVLPFKATLAAFGLLDPVNTLAWDIFDAAMAAAVVAFQGANNLPSSGILDAQTARVISVRLAGANQFAVAGTVTDASGRPAAGLLARAFIPHVGRADQPLGEAGLDTRGNYAIIYTPPPDRQPDLLVRLLDANGGEIAASGLHCRMPPVQVIDLQLSLDQYRGPSEFERNLGELSASLGNLSLGDLDEAGIDRLACKTVLPIDQFRHLRLDAVYAREHNFTAGIFYGLLRQGLPEDYHRLLQEKPSRWRAALESSVRQNLVPIYEPAAMDAFMAQLQGLAVENAFAAPPAGAPPGLGSLMRTSSLDETAQQTIVSFALGYEGPQADFWTKLRQQTKLGAAAIGEAQFTLQSAALTFNHLPTLSALQHMKAQQGWSSLRDLAQLTLEDWEGLIAEHGGSFPGEYDSLQAYAAAINLRVESTYPTAVVAHRLLASDGLASADLAIFFNSNPEFDLLHGSVDAYFADGAVMDGVTDPDALRTEVKSVQRVMRIVTAGHWGTAVPALMGAGYGSATAIAGASQTDFLGTMSPRLGEDLAGDIWEGARHRADAVRMVALGVRDWVDSPRSPFMPHVTPDEDTSTWAGLFGRVSYCECEHCRSVYSPAAYLADLLKYLRDAPRRLFSADHPFDDLGPLHELLLRRPDLAHILLNCENANTRLPYIDLVNELLEDAVLRLGADGALPAPEAIPAPAPDAPETEVASYLDAIAPFQTTWPEARLRAQPEHERLDAMNRLGGASFPWSLPFDPAMERAWFFSDYLGLNLYRLWELFAQPQIYRAMAFLRISLAEWRLITQAAAGDAELAANWGVGDLSALGSVQLFLKHSGLTYDELQALVETAFFADSSGAPLLRIAPLPGADPCDLDSLRLEGLTPALLDFIHRYLRLQRTLGWSIPFLDEVLTTFGMNRDTSAVMANIAFLVWHLRLLAEALRTPVKDAVRLYQLPEGLRASHWGKAFRLAEAEFEQLLEVLAERPYTSPQRCLQMLEKQAALRSAGFSVGELRYILNHQDQTPPAFAPHPEDQAEFLRALHAFVPEYTARRLGEAHEEIERAVADFATTAGDGEAAIAAFREETIQRLRQRFGQEAIVANLAQLLALEPQLVERLIQPQTDATGAALTEAILHAVDQASQPAIRDLNEFVNLPAGETDPDVTTTAAYGRALRLLIRLDKAARILRRIGIDLRELEVMAALRSENDFLDFNELPTSSEIPAGASGGWAVSLQRMIEARQLQKELRRGDYDLFDLLQHAIDETAYPPDGLGRPETFDFLAEHTGWISADLVRLRRAFRFNSEAFRSYVTYRKLLEAHRLARRSRTPVIDLARWYSYNWVTGAASIVTVAGQLEAAARAKHASDEAWYETLTPLMDRLREKKRDALLAYLMHQAKDSDGQTLFPDAIAVYDHFLIDAEMSSCFLTSRIVQANASVQLFIQRLLMNLEEYKALADSQDAQRYWREWEWRKKYRVWEANRKVFLYPENWIEAELRDDKSPLFFDLENELMQGELTGELIETACASYLEKLYEVSRLDIRSLYYDKEPNVLHIIGRTYSDPHIYYYRRREADRSWSPWERMDIEIEGDHLIVWVHGGRLYIFWATLAGTTIQGEEGTNPQRYVDIKLYWSEYSKCKWIASRTSRDETFRYYFSRYDQAPGNIHFQIGVDADSAEFLEITMFVTPSHYLDFDVLPDELGTGVDIYDRHYYVPDLYPHSIARYIFDPLHRKILLDKRTVEITLMPKPIVERLDTVMEGRYFIQSRFEAMELVRHVADPDGSEPLDIISRVTRTSPAAPKLIEQLPAILADSIIVRAEWEPRYYEIHRDRTFWADPYTLSYPSSYLLFSHVPDNSRLVLSPIRNQYAIDQPFVYKDSARTYLVHHHMAEEIDLEVSSESMRAVIEMLYHPYGRYFIQQTYAAGIHALLAPPFDHLLDRQAITEKENTVFEQLFGGFKPPHILSDPKEMISFELTDSYGLYNWELFFHIPLLIASRFSQEQRFEEAQHWFHYIFDPTDTSAHPAPARYWKVKPFYEMILEPLETIEDLMHALTSGDEGMEQQVRAWRNDPFNPHRIARMRIIAYMKAVFMKYVDNLIAWGDFLFNQDSMETINEATQLYLLAAKLLGERPVQVEGNDPAAQTFAAIQDRLDAFSNLLIEIESGLPVMTASVPLPDTPPVPGSFFYFCLPPNEKLLGYWHTVADRLFKIRHCMNIEGQVRQLPLFEPPIDPALLVRARALGLDLSQALLEIATPNLPQYRYAFTYQKALELCGEVRSLGNLLLATLEKRDAEDLALMRSGHELSLLLDIRRIKDQQVREAKESLESLQTAMKLIEQRHEYYSSREFMNSAEQTQLGLMVAATYLQAISQMLENGAASSYIIPDAYAGALAGVGGGALTFAKVAGGSSIGAGVEATARAAAMLASYLNSTASILGTMGSYQRRRDEWMFLANQALTEAEQVEKQIVAAEIRLAIAEQDLANHEKQIEQSREIDGFMRSKFTNRELYNWMVSQLSALFYQAYQMAYELARKAERAALYELGHHASEFTFIKFDHWDHLKRGLLAGERLQHQLQRMDAAYHDQNRRELEITKHISLAMLNPLALVELKETGRCTVELPEWLFDLDYPGHYLRRIKSLSLTIPCVTGPYTGIHCTLTQTSQAIRHTDAVEREDHAAGLTHYPGAARSIATSSGQNDAGVFELNFRDERYLPFEGSGVISAWELELSGKWRVDGEVIDLAQFDFDTVSDVILHVSYTARHSDDLKAAALGDLQAMLAATTENALVRLFSLRHEFPNAWHAFLYGEAPQRMEFEMSQSRFPFFAQGRIIIREAHLLLKTVVGVDGSDTEIAFNRENLTFIDGYRIGEISSPLPGAGSLSAPTLGTWTLQITALPEDLQNSSDRLDPEKVEDIFVICLYKLE